MKKNDGIIERKTDIMNVKTDMWCKFNKFKESRSQQGKKSKLIDPNERSRRI